MKRIIVGKSGTGKSKWCFEIADKYKGTVVYLSGVPYDGAYEKYGYIGDYEISTLQQTVFMENNKKYFIAPENFGDYMPLSDVVSLFGLEIDNIFTRKINTKLLLIIDDSYWERSKENKALLLWKLTHVNTDVIITIWDWKDLLDVNITEGMYGDIRRNWEICRVESLPVDNIPVCRKTPVSYWKDTCKKICAGEILDEADWNLLIILVHKKFLFGNKKRLMDWMLLMIYSLKDDELDEVMKNCKECIEATYTPDVQRTAEGNVIRVRLCSR